MTDIQEISYLLSTPANAERLKQSLEQAQNPDHYTPTPPKYKKLTFSYHRHIQQF